MIILKIIYHLSAIVHHGFYKLIYGSRLSIGKGTTWRKHLSILIDSGGKVKIGKNCFFNNYCSINSNVIVSIGDNSIFGEGVKIYDQNHRFRSSETNISEQGFSCEEVTIGENCWIGSNAVILKGTHIGSHCVIGAGAVVSGDIPDNTLVKASRELTMEKIIS